MLLYIVLKFAQNVWRIISKTQKIRFSWHACTIFLIPCVLSYWPLDPCEKNFVTCLCKCCFKEVICVTSWQHKKHKPTSLPRNNSQDDLIWPDRPPKLTFNLLYIIQILQIVHIFYFTEKKPVFLVNFQSLSNLLAPSFPLQEIKFWNKLEEK
jgi:hypothetical protein